METLNLSLEDQARVMPQLELLHSLRDAVAENLNLLASIDQVWQPTDYLPDMTAENWHAQLMDFRTQAESLTDETLVVLVGDMVTEEALPNYAISLNLIAADYTGVSPDPWATWSRGWTSEENRHGDLLNAFLRLTGRVDMRAVEVTVQYLIGNGFNPRAFPDPYAGLVYTAFQERATRISHFNVAKQAARCGDERLALICKKIAGDESRHEQFYTRMMGEVMERDPAGGLVVMRQMLRRIIAMPGRQMFDGKDPDLFDHFAAVAQRMGVYTARDYAGIVKHLVATWRIADLAVSGKAASAQDFMCSHAEQLDSIVDQIQEAALKQPPTRFSWIHDRVA
jgi:acyl-[acyl-carrier-protein] desaturase